jgi:dipeptidyl aminopeptidase/acylaminoacyl peptidase
MQRTILALLLILVAPLAPLRAQEPARDHDITIDDYFSLSLITASAISPDGKYVAYSEARWQKSTGDRKSDLWIVDTNTAKAKKLTSDRCNPRSLAWSTDSKTVYFLANRKRESDKQPPFDGKTQVWRINPNGGGFSAVTQIEGGVEAFAITGDGKHLFYVTHHDDQEDEWKDLRSKHPQLEYAHGTNKVSRVWRLDTETWRTEKVIDDKRYIYEIALTPDGSRLAMITAPDDRVVHFEGKSRVDVWDAATKKITPIPDECYRKNGRSAYAWIEHVAIAPDGKTVAFNAIWDGYPAEIVLGSASEGGWKSHLMTRPENWHVMGYGSPLTFAGDGTLNYLAERKGRVLAAAHSEKDNVVWNKISDATADAVVSQLSVDRSGKRRALVMATPTEFADVYLEDGKGLKRLTNINPQVASWKLPELSVVTWKGANGDPVEGILELPPGYKSGQKVPLVVDIHGGPTTAYYYDRLFAWYSGKTILPARGYAVLTPNYRGSTGYGDKFLIDLIGRENDWDVQDILKGVEHLVDKGIADPDKLVVMGWSNGGYLTNCCITHTTRFKAAISGAGIIDAVMEFGANDEPAYSIVFKKGFPWSASNRYQEASPSWRLDKVKTPTLIHVGGGDERCPPGHSRTLYRVLKEYNHVPVELLTYPGEPHGLRKYDNIRAKMEWDQAWLNRYVGGKAQ